MNSKILLTSIAVLLVGCQMHHTSEICNHTPASARKIPDIILDNTELGFKVEGTWYTGWSDEDHNNGSMWAWGEKKADSWATWEYTIYAGGTYEVFEWHSGDPNYDHAYDTPHTIYYTGGSKTIPVNQQKDEGKWNSLGAYPFAQDTIAKIVIGNKAHGNVVADAVKLVYKSEQ